MKDGKRGRRRWVRWAILGALVAAAGGAGFFFLGSSRQQSAAAPRYTVYTVQAVRENDVIEVSGNIKPIEEEDIGFSSSGKVAAIHVKEGDRVKAGTLVAELDNSEQVYALASLDSQIEKTRIGGSKQDLALLELERQSKVTALEDRKLYTTISGVVTSLDIRKGELIKSVNDITPIMHISNLSAMKAEVEVDEIDAPRLALGQKVSFTFDALPGVEIVGRVSAVPLEARVTGSGIAVMDAELTIDAPPAGLVSGYSFAAEIHVGDARKTLLLDEKAVLQRGDRTLVLKAGEAGGRPTPTPVSSAPYGGGKVKILSGLSEGDRVVSADAQGAAWGAGAGQNAGGGTSPLRLLGLPQGPRGMRPRSTGGGSSR